MAITCGFFNSKLVNGQQDRRYNADQISLFFEGFISDGVFQTIGGGLQVKASSGMMVQVMTGRAKVDNRWLKNDAIYDVELQPSHVTLNRYTAVILRVDYNERTVTITTKDSDPASEPVQPAMERSTAIKEYCLAYVYVGRGVTDITQSMITDTRPDNAVCGWVVSLVEQLDLHDAFLQYQAAGQEDRAKNQSDFDTWFSGIQQSGESDMQQNQSDWDDWFDDMQTRGTASLNNYQASFDTWFEKVKNTFLGTATLIRSYTNVYTTSEDNETEIPIGISEYNNVLDILQVYINGMQLVPNVEYHIMDDTKITLTNALCTGTPVSFVVFKSIDGSDAETVVSEVHELQQKTSDSGWLDLPLVEGITGETAKYRKIGNVIYLSGEVTGTGTNIATLPEGYRPAAARRFIQASSTGALVICTVNTDGTIAANGEISDTLYLDAQILTD